MQGSNRTVGSIAKCASKYVALALSILSLTAWINVGSAQELKPLATLTHPGLIIQQNLRVAIAAGFFKKYGLDVTAVQVESGPAGIAAVQGGSVDIGTVDANLLLLANSKGGDFQIVCGASTPYFAAVAGPGLALPNLGLGYPAVMKDLVGKKLGVTALGSTSHFFWRSLFEGAGLDPESATYVTVGLAAPAVQALRTQRIDAYMGFEPVPTVIRHGGLGGKTIVDLRSPASQGPPELTQINLQHIVFAKRSFITANPDKVTAFNRALTDAAAWQRDPANLDKLIEIMKPTASVGDVQDSDAAFRKMIQDNIPVTSATKVSREGIRGWVKLLQKFASYPSTIDLDKTLDATIWKGACV